MAFEYIDHSIAVMNEIRNGGLELYSEITHIDKTGGGSNFASIGTVDLNGRPLHVGVKYQADSHARNMRVRMYEELRHSSFLHDHTPSLRVRLPEFIGQVSVQGQITGVITEDVTRNGSLQIYPTAVSRTDVQALKNYFPDDELSEIIDVGQLQRSLAFEVNGEHRWLDFTPPIFDNAFIKRESFKAHSNEIWEQKEELTLEIASLEELGITDYKKS